MARRPDWDDGRTIADMSGVDGLPSLRRKKEKPLNVPEEEEEARSWEDTSMSRQDRRAYVLGAMGATALIGSVYVAAFALLIFLLLRWLT